MIVHFSLLFIITLFGSYLIDWPTMLYLWVIYLAGIAVASIASKSSDKKTSIKIYQVLFSVGSIYMIAIYMYMISHGYEYLLAYDTIKYFLPMTENFLDAGNYLDALKSIWSDYTFFSRFHIGYFSYSTFFAFIAQYFDANFYVSQQISVLFLYPFVGILLYKLFLINKFDKKKAYKYALITSLFSIIFFYSSIILRDLHILLLYLIGIYYTFKPEFSLITLFKIIIVIYLSILMRIETGLFLTVLIPTYILLTTQSSKYKLIIFPVSMAILSALLFLSMQYFNKIMYTFSRNQAGYIENVAEGSGMIATFQNIPIAGDLISIIYTAAQPLPFWRKFSAEGSSLGPETYNIMTFPQSIASFFNWIVIIYIFSWLLSKNIRNKVKGFIRKPLQYHLWIGLVFLFIQAAVVEQRRIMAYYCMYYILFFIIFDRITPKERNQINIVAISSFFLLQIIGIYYKIGS